MPADALGILLIDGGHERAHYAFVLAAGAAAIGRPVVLFATNAGCRAMLLDWSSLAHAARDATIQGQGVAGLDELRAASIELGVRLLACDAGLRMADIDPGQLHPAVEVAGVPSFLNAIGNGQIISL